MWACGPATPENGGDKLVHGKGGIFPSCGRSKTLPPVAFETEEDVALYLPRLIDINPTGGAYIYSTSEPYDLQMELSVERLRNWVRRFNLTLVGDPEIDTPEHHGFHAGGHAPGEDIYKLIEIINPQLLIPIHTLYPDLMAASAAELNIPVHVPEFGMPVPIG